MSNRDISSGRDDQELNPTPGTTPVQGDSQPDATSDEQHLAEWQTEVLGWLNSPPERSRPSVVLPRPPYFDRTIVDRERFMERAKPKITKDILKQIIRGGGDLLRGCLEASGSQTLYIPTKLSMASKFAAGDIEVPIGVDEPSWWPGRDKPGGGGGSGNEPGEDDADIVYMPISYEEFIELIGMLFDLPFLRPTDADKLMTMTMKMRGLKRSGPMVRLEKQATAKARIERFFASINAHPENYPGLDREVVPTPEQFPFHKVDLRYKRVEEKWDPDSKAVVFYELDCSGSMSGEPLAIAKFFFLLVLIWLKTKYTNVTVVYIAHNHAAYRVPTQGEFFRIIEDGGTAFWPAHELVYNIWMTEFSGGNGWNGYTIHATDGFGDSPTAWIEKLIRSGMNLFGYFEIDPYGYGGSFMTGGMQACLNVAADVKPHVGIGKARTMDDVPKAAADIIDKAHPGKTGA